MTTPELKITTQGRQVDFYMSRQKESVCELQDFFREESQIDLKTWS